MADFELKVSADTQAASRQLEAVDKVANEATKPRQIKLEIPNYSSISKNFSDLGRDIDNAANNIKQFYKIAGRIPGSPIQDINETAIGITKVGKSATEASKSLADAGAVFTSTFNTANKASAVLISRLTRLALSIYVIKEAVGAVQSAFGGLFKDTVGREIQLRETILKTQTTLAATNKVFRGDKEVTDPFEKIVLLTGEVRKNIDSIRERSIALAGVTSNEVIEVFGIVASQISQIGGGLKEAEDLAINFSAALGTFGIPLYQARQEIGSILRGDITMDSYLAKSLGITNEDIAKAKTQAGGVVKFLEERLAAAVAGQRIAAEGFAGVVSNIKDLGELIGQNFGAGLLDPLIGGLTTIFNFLFEIRNEMFAISKLAGNAVGEVVSGAVGVIAGATGGFRQTVIKGKGGRGAQYREIKKEETSSLNADKVLKGIEGAVKRVQVEINKAISTVYLQIATLTERIASAFKVVSKGLANLALGLLSLKLENFKAAIGILESVSPILLTAAKAVGAFLAVWGEVLKLPIVQQITQISTGMRVLQVTGIMPAIRTGFILKSVLSSWGTIIGVVQKQFVLLRSIIGGVILWIGQLVTQAGKAGVALLTAWQPAGKALQALRAELLTTVGQLEAFGNTAERAGNKIGGFDRDIGKVGGGLKKLLFGMIKFQILMFAISAVLSIVTERYSAWKESQDKIASDKRAEVALERLQTTYKDLAQSTDEATKRAKAFEESLVNAKYDEAVQRLESLKAKIAEIKDLTSDNEQNFGGYMRRLLQLFNPANMDSLFDIRPGELFSDAVYRKRLEQEKDAEADKAKWVQAVNAKAALDNLRMEADKRINLEKEIKDIRMRQENELFRQRQNLAQQEVQIFRAAGELRILQLERANAKLIEGEEGASQAALAALNNYLEIRERGELDIESAKKAIIIEVANLEKEVANYRIDNEKKIAEIKRRAGKYEKDVADYRRQAAGTTPTGGRPLVGGATVKQRNDPDGEQTGSDIALAGGRGAIVQNPFANLKITGTGFQGSGSGESGSGFGNYVTGVVVIDGKNYEVLLGHLDKIDVKVGDILGSGANIGQQGITGRATGPHVSTHVNALNGGDPQSVLRDIETAWTSGVSIPSGGFLPDVEPKAPSYEDIDAPAVEKYASAVRAVASAMERVRVLQAALTEAKTAAAFEQIAKAMFPVATLEQYRDQIIESKTQLEALGSATNETYDPERVRIMVETKTKELIKDKEIKEFENKALEQRKKGVLTEQEFVKLQDNMATNKKKFLEDLKKERNLREQILTLTREQQMREGLKNDIRNIQFNIRRAEVQASASMASSYASNDPVAQRLLEAEVRIAEKKIELEQQYFDDHQKVAKELAVFTEKTLAAAKVLGELDKRVIEFKSTMEMIKGAAQTLTDAMKGFAKTVLSGGDLNQAMTAMLENIAGRFLDMALEAAFKPMEEQLISQFKTILDLKDPKEELQKLNNTELSRNTAALTTLATALATASGLTPNGSADANPSPNALVVPALPGTTTGNEQSTSVEKAEGAYSDALDKATDIKNQESDQARQTSAKQMDFGKALAGATQAFGAIAMGIAGVRQMGKGGTYNTLMGLAGIFGAIGSITGMFGTGGIFAPKPQASGGPIKANRPYIVGEIGPELFMPNSDGEIVSNAKSRKLLSAAALAGKTQTFSTNVNSRRNANPAQVQFDFAYQSEVINNVEYVTSDQFRKGMADSAERGKNMAFQVMQNSVTTRRRLGL